MERKARERQKRQQEDEQRRAMCLTNQRPEPHSTLPSSSFCNGAFEAVIMADPDADDNLMRPYVLNPIVNANTNLKVEEPSKKLEFQLVMQ